jgi:hypothetical protein
MKLGLFKPHWGIECLCIAMIAFGTLLAWRDANLRQRDLTWQLMTSGEFARATIINWEQWTTTLTSARARECTQNDVKWGRCATTDGDSRAFSFATQRVDLSWQDPTRRRHTVRNFVIEKHHVERLELDFSPGTAPKTLPIRYRIPDAVMDIEQEQRDWDARRRRPDQPGPCMPSALCRLMMVDRPDYSTDEITVLGLFDLSFTSAAGWFLILGGFGLLVAAINRVLARGRGRRPPAPD